MLKPIIKVSLCLEGRFSFFCDIVKLICELQHKIFINLRFRQISNLQPSALFYKNLHSAACKFTHSVDCGSTYAPLPAMHNSLFLSCNILISQLSLTCSVQLQMLHSLKTILQSSLQDC